MTRFSLLSLLLAITLVAVSLGWWVERSRKPEVFYLHLFATHFDYTHDIYHPKINSKVPNQGEPVRIASLAISPNTPFWAELPNHYDPTMHIEGELQVQQKQFRGRLKFGIEAPYTVFNSDHVAATLDQRNPLQDDQFYFVISRSKDPYSLIEQPDTGHVTRSKVANEP